MLSILGNNFRPDLANIAGSCWKRNLNVNWGANIFFVSCNIELKESASFFKKIDSTFPSSSFYYAPSHTEHHQCTRAKKNIFKIIFLQQYDTMITKAYYADDGKADQSS